MATENHEQDQKLSDAALLAAIVESSDDAIVSKNLDGVVTSWNRAAERIFGYSAEEMIGQSIRRLIPPDRPNEEQEILARIRRGERVDHFQTVRRRKDGALIDVSVTISPVMSAEGRIIGASKVARDITVYKRLVQDLEQYAADQASQSRQKDEFLAMLAHELRNPLAPILNAIQVLRSHGPADAVQQRQFVVLDRQARQMSRLLDDLLDVSRITRGKIELRCEALEVGPLLEQAAETARPLFERKEQHFQLETPEEPLYVFADPTRMQQILSNLLTNAAKYTPPGGVITLSVGQDGREVCFRVKDNGQGIEPDLLPRIFDLFVQDDRPECRDESGLGIGLTMVRRLVQLHGGVVEAHSEGAGRGSEFVVRLPMIGRATGGDTPREPAPGGTSTRARSVLVVDDNRDAADTLADLISLWGHEVRCAYEGAGGLQAAGEYRPDVILLDISMPGMSGYDVARALRRHAHLDRTLLVALTGYGQEEDRRRALEAGFDHHLTKPVDPELLRRFLDQPERAEADRQ
jgi:two-component system CheB/CheR fusion protein